MYSRHFRLKGIVLIEMSVVLPLLLLLVFGILSFGIALYDQTVITNASRVGARKAVVSIISGSGMDSYPTCSATSASTPVTTASGARTTARCAALKAISDGLISFGIGSSPTIDAQSFTASGGACTDPPGPNCYIKVTVSYPFIGVYIVDALTLSASTSMFYE